MSAIEEAEKLTPPKRLTRLEAAALAGVSLSKIKRAIKTNRLHSVKNEGSRWILYTDFVSWLGYDPLKSEPH